jgi:FkbM family methyltransferase
MAAPSSDDVIARSLRFYGEWAEHELSILRPFVLPGTFVVDVGANIGTHTLAFSRWVRDGRVIAIEAQPALSYILQNNCQQNACHNVDVINAICADRRGSRRLFIDYDKLQNLGAVSFAHAANGFGRIFTDLLDGVRRRQGVRLRLIRLDDICTEACVTLIKIDVEGMELAVLRGAHKTLKSNQPAIYLEQNSAENLPHIHEFLENVGYRLFWLETHPYNQLNFRGERQNIWWRTETGILALPKPLEPTEPLVKVRPDDPSPPHRLDAREGIAVHSSS